jgi:DNA-binding MarR family transcriptional regulator
MGIKSKPKSVSAPAKSPPTPLREVPSDTAYRALAKEFMKIGEDKIEFFLSCKNLKTEVDLKIEAFYAQFNLSPGRFQILMILRCASDYALPPSELADKAGVSRASMTQFLDALEKAGYVTRKDFPGDRRATLIQISPKSLKILNKKILPLYFQRMAHFSDRCTKTEMKTFTSMYEKISANLSHLEAKQNKKR